MLDKNEGITNKTNVFKVPKSLAERIIRVSKAKQEFNNMIKSSDNKNCIAYREWGNAGYSIYNDRG